MALTKQQIQETNDAFEKHGCSKAKAAAELVPTRSMFQHRLDRMAPGVDTAERMDSQHAQERIIAFSKPRYRVPYAEAEKVLAPANDEAIRV